MQPGHRTTAQPQQLLTQLSHSHARASHHCSASTATHTCTAITQPCQGITSLLSPNSYSHRCGDWVSASGWVQVSSSAQGPVCHTQPEALQDKVIIDKGVIRYSINCMQGIRLGKLDRVIIITFSLTFALIFTMRRWTDECSYFFIFQPHTSH